jgi:homeobox protein cut-like
VCLTYFTQDFRKQTDDEKIKGIGPLLKLYQEEIDELTKRCKYSENSFLSLYKLLADAPDPISGLTAVNVSLLS